MKLAETACCTDCYSISYRDEMNQCPVGHFVCPGCICDCEVLAHARAYVQDREAYDLTWQSWDAARSGAVSAIPVPLE